MKRTIFFIGTAGLTIMLAAGAYFAYESGLLVQPQVVVAASTPEVSAAAEPEILAAPAKTLDNVVEQADLNEGEVIVDARVEPADSAQLSMSAGGIVKELLIEEGQTVKAGELLVRLDSALQQVSIAQAQAQLQRAQANLQQLIAGARAEEIAASEAQVNAAKARLTSLTEAALPGQIAQAQASVAAANAGLAKVLEGADSNSLIAARAEIAMAEASLTQAQRAYDEVKYRNDIGALPQSAALQQASTQYEAAKARLAVLERGATNADINAANAEVRRAQVNLATLEKALPSDTAVAEADLAISEAQLDLVLAGARPEQIAAAEADVACRDRFAATGAGWPGLHRTTRTLQRHGRRSEPQPGRAGQSLARRS
jgi:HlyD family secretion protein